ncbi:NUDIX domain-containing protein [Effusibacillus pohliae]|uniref:NUDIX domain-containing protein n=1 Tax=Effusibacillus pohliae TaxID=232270 RepID=UPI0003816339|nr:NUDIX domain-containing protein [Effusibacillus pohliae]
MIYQRQTYQIRPEHAEPLNRFFHAYLLPNRVKNGARLVGCWITENRREITAIWEYPNLEEYRKIEERVQKDELHRRAQAECKQRELYLACREEFLQSTGSYPSPQQTVTVSGYITNEQQEALLVRTYWRSDTWELPGGGVEAGETLDAALCREILEETGIHVNLHGITGVYSNGSTISIVFRGTCQAGPTAPSNETKEVRFQKIDETNLASYITRPKFRSRVLDSMRGICVPYEAFRVRPYQLVRRYDPHREPFR